MMTKIATLAVLLIAATTVGATEVTNIVVDIADSEPASGACATVVSFDDAPDVELLGCASSSDGITVPTELGDVTVKCDVNGGGPNGANQCLNQRVVCRAGCCATMDMQDSDASCTIPDFCTSGDCLLCVEMVPSNAPQPLTC
ncbi:hypothetical protein NKR23_g5418 [Pleurostoma richardsiae]|jgi:hypothetical protein|uniref:Uncharacterized protein n=1 Tax=Pleurostoma richardsiae TaxID=41990 RepID=A0AA38RP48_9PEZI|nr:hypothetical protein NKR23_g5418 [Pleurostoma richardsiae]